MADLNETYKVYFHCPNSNDWTIKSYKCLGTIYTTDDFWMFHTAIKEYLHKGMFFIMKCESFPIWDDESNKDGGVLCIKILKSQLYEYWEDLCIKTLGETLLKEEHREYFDEINGISVSPKRTFVIVKVWLRSDRFNDPKYFNIPEGYYGDVIYKSNMENICHQK